jgi:predicted transposase YbfD/YdcC
MGKRLLAAMNEVKSKVMIYRVSAWAHQNRPVLEQRKVHEKSNEMTVIPELLSVLDLEGAVVTIDAKGCQTAIAAQIVAQKGNYLLVFKGNQGDIYQGVRQLFDHAQARNFRDIEHDFYQTQEQGQRRAENRRYWVMGQTKYLIGAENWEKLTMVGCVASQRQIGDKISNEVRYYLLSLSLDAQRFAEVVRGHGGIENQLHWILDVGFREDDSRATQGYSADNLAVIRHLTVNLLTQEKTAKGGTRAKHIKAGWDEHYLSRVLSHSLRPPSKPSRKL